jgi:hypothetical protein
MLLAGGLVGYLFGDSTESGLEFNYLAFLREAVDCAVAMVECDVTLATVADRKRTREREMETELAAVAELGKRAAELVAPVAKQQADTPVGRCASAIATAIREAVERESTALRTKLATQRDELDKDGQGINARAKEAIEKLLRTHDLPGAEKELEVTWTSTGVKATMTQRTAFGVEAVLALDVPPSSLFTPDLRVDRVADGIEVHAREAGGWIKKSDKLVVHRLGRYHVTSITIGATVRIQLRADTNAGEMTIISPPSGDLMIDAAGNGAAREILIEERDRPRLRAFVDKLEAATRVLSDSRGQLVSIELDKKSLGEPGKPRLFAERLTAAIAPTVHKIKAHSRNPDELVIRRLLGDNRREEIFVPIAELVQRFDVLPAHARGVFAPLQLQGEPAFTPVVKAPDLSASDAKPVEAKPVEPKPSEVKPAEMKSVEIPPLDKSVDRSLETKPIESRPIEVRIPSVPMPERPASNTSPPPIARPANRTSPPMTAIPEPIPARAKESTQPFASPAAEPSRGGPPPPPPAQDYEDEEWPAISRDDVSDKPVSS